MHTGPHDDDRVPVARLGHGAQRMDPRQPQRPAASARAARRTPARRASARAGASSSARRWGRRPARCSATSARGCSASTTSSSRPTTRGCSTSSVRTSPRWNGGSRCRARDFRLWIAIHEVTHRVQFGSAPWLRGHLQGLVDKYLQADLARRQGAGGPAPARGRGGARRRRRAAWAASSCCSRREQREMFVRMQALMSLLEGHASYVMNEVARDHVADVDRMRRALAARRRGSSMERSIQKAIGFEQKIQQYDGRRTVRARGDRDARAWTTFNLVWVAPDQPADARRGRRARALARAGRRARPMRRPPAVARVLERVTATVARARHVPAEPDRRCWRSRAVPIRCAWSSRWCASAGS